MASTPLRNIRVDEDLWRDFGEAAAAVGSTRTEVLVALMRRYVSAMAIPRSADTDLATDLPPSVHGSS